MTPKCTEDACWPQCMRVRTCVECIACTTRLWRLLGFWLVLRVKHKVNGNRQRESPLHTLTVKHYADTEAGDLPSSPFHFSTPPQSHPASRISGGSLP